MAADTRCGKLSFTFIAHAQVEFSEGSTIFRKGDPGDEFYIVRKGTALVLDGSGKVGMGAYLSKSYKTN